MAKYLIKVSYTPAGAKGVLKEGGSKRKTAVEQMVKKMGESWRRSILLW